VRRVGMMLLAGAALYARPAFAADTLKFGPAPAWVVPQAIPDKSTKAANAPAAILLTDEQAQLAPGKSTSFVEIAIKLQTADGLSGGNIAFPWNPAFDTVTVNKVHIIRGDKVIDVLGAGQTFTIARRETNLDAATLDGTLTAALQPEGLEVGDIVDFAVTIEHSDPTVKNHVEGEFASWNAVPIELGHVRISWPATMKLLTKQSDGVPAAHRFTDHGQEVLELSDRGIEPSVPPNAAPTRYRIGRLGEVTDFQSWADLTDLFMPLFQKAAMIPGSGPLRDEVENIRKQAHTPKDRAELALQLVENRVRYVDLAMGTGGLVPASAETTWARRFGDCKAKTALLLAILHELGIQAEPVLAHHKLGDALSGFLPMVGDFDHVLVRAHIGAKDYWLDGTRTGDTDLDSIPVPDLGWVLPLTAKASLVHLVPPPLDSPSREDRVDIDASNGVFAPAAITINELYRGDSAVELNTLYSALSADQKDQSAREEAKAYFDGFAVASSSFEFDKAKREFDITIKGKATLGWKDTWLQVPTSSIGFDPDWDRSAGPLHDVPVEISHPRFVKDRATIILPSGFAAEQKLSAPVHETLAGVEYARSESVSGDVLTVDSSERSLVPEISYKQALSAEPRLRTFAKDDVYLSSAVAFRATRQDLTALAATTPSSADDYISRGNLYLNGHKYDEAIADYTEALKLEPHNKWALANRGLTHVWKLQFEEGEKDLDAAAALDPDNSVLTRARGLMAEFKGECSKAVAFYTKSLSQDPHDTFTIGHRATCEANLHNDDAALSDSAEALKTDSTWMDLRVLRANIFMLEGKHDLVTAEADAMTRANPKSDYAWVAAAKTYAALGQRDRAMQAFDRALAIKPQAYIYVNREQIRSRIDVSDRAADLESALKLEPDNEAALTDKARLLADKGDYKGALTVLEKVKPDGDDQYVAEQRAIVLYKAGRAGEAEKLIQSLRSAAKTASQLNGLCWAQATEDVLLESALDDCRAALKLNPGAGAYLDSLGMVLLKLGKLDEALDAYNEAVAKDVGADSLMGRAFVYLRKGDRVRADADASAARKLSPQIDEIFAGYGLKFGDTPTKTTIATQGSSRLAN
jgi:tetratricopeptide (TPR) repeat protein